MKRKLSIFLITVFIVNGVFALTFFNRNKTMNSGFDTDKAEYYQRKATTGVRPWIRKKKYKLKQWYKEKKNIRDAKQIEKEWAKVEKM